jgi:hypothetical protein
MFYEVSTVCEESIFALETDSVHGEVGGGRVEKYFGSEHVIQHKKTRRQHTSRENKGIDLCGNEETNFERGRRIGRKYYGSQSNHIYN